VGMGGPHGDGRFGVGMGGRGVGGGGGGGGAGVGGGGGGGRWSPLQGCISKRYLHMYLSIPIAAARGEAGRGVHLS